MKLKLAMRRQLTGGKACLALAPHGDQLIPHRPLIFEATAVDRLLQALFGRSICVELLKSRRSERSNFFWSRVTATNQWGQSAFCHSVIAAPALPRYPIGHG